MHREAATPTDPSYARQPGHDHAERNGDGAEHTAMAAFEHGTDAQIIKRVNTMTPLVTPTLRSR